jgi:hypothetical protein
VNWGTSYTSNSQTMGAQANNSNCIFCHPTSGPALAVEDAHTHPLKDPSFNPGLDIVASNLVEAGTNDGDGTIDPGERIGITLTVKDGSGADVAPSALSSISLVLSGPTSNYNLVLNGSIPVASLTGSQPFTIHVPQQLLLEYVGNSTAGLQSFTTARTPHWTPTSSLTTVRVRTATSGGSSTLSAATAPPANFIDVASAAGFAHDDYVVIDDGVAGFEEYLRIQQVDGTRLWFSSPSSTGYAIGPRVAHTLGATVKEVTLTSQAETTNYTVNAATGTITEVTDFGANRAVVVTYTTDFVMPATYPVAINGSPGLNESSGKWTGLALADGTYTLGIWGQQNLSLVLFGETNSYRNVSLSHNLDFLVGSATAIAPYDLISSGASCSACHQDVSAHGGGRRGFETCVVCHGTAGSEDRPQYVAASAPATTGTTVNFRTMLHKIHMGKDLANASSYSIVGFGSGAGRTTSARSASRRSGSPRSRVESATASSATARARPGRTPRRATIRRARPCRPARGALPAARATTPMRRRLTSTCRPPARASSRARCVTGPEARSPSSSSTRCARGPWSGSPSRASSAASRP